MGDSDTSYDTARSKSKSKSRSRPKHQKKSNKIGPAPKIPESTESNTSYQ